MKILLEIFFETGDVDPAYCLEFATIDSDLLKCEEIADAFKMYFKSNNTFEMEFREIVCNVLNEAGLNWRPVNSAIPGCDTIFIIWV